MTQVAQLLAAPNVDAAAQTLAGWSKAQFAAFLKEIATPPASAPVAWMWDTQLTPYKPSDYVNPRPLYAHPAPRGRVVVTEAMEKAAVDAWWNSAGDANDAIRAALSAALVDADAEPPRGRVVTEAMVNTLHAAASDLRFVASGGECDRRTLAEHADALLALVDADAPEVDRG